jgi:hypothetical protein
MGGSVAQPWTVIQPSVPPNQPTTCPGFMPSRLLANYSGRVTPGDANNLRAQPSSSAERVGQIPGGDYFFVLAGPTCAENTAWWQVDYNGTVGWTAEGQGTTYWLEPAQ